MYFTVLDALCLIVARLVREIFGGGDPPVNKPADSADDPANPTNGIADPIVPMQPAPYRTRGNNVRNQRTQAQVTIAWSVVKGHIIGLGISRCNWIGNRLLLLS